MGYAGSRRGLVNLDGISGIILTVVLYFRCNNGSYSRSTFISLAGGWRQPPPTTCTPVPHANGLKLNITDADNALDLELALEAAGYFRVNHADALDIIARLQEVVSQARTGWGIGTVQA